jgi:hypothetical protein
MAAGKRRKSAPPPAAFFQGSGIRSVVPIEIRQAYSNRSEIYDIVEGIQRVPRNVHVKQLPHMYPLVTGSTQ